MEEFFRTRLPAIADSSIRLALALAAMPVAGAKITRSDLCFRSGIAPSQLDRALRDAEVDKILSMKARAGGHTILLTSDIDGGEHKITLLPSDSLEAEIESLRAERMSLVLKLRRADDDSGLADEIPLEEGSAARLAEAIIGRALDVTEAYRLGQMIQGYGPDRVKAALNMKRRSKQPLRAAYAFLLNGARGPAAPQKEAPKPVAYFTPADDFTPY